MGCIFKDNEKGIIMALVLDKLVSAKIGEYSCTECDNKVNTILSRQYRVEDVKSGKAKCRNCEFLRSVKQGGLDKTGIVWGEACLNELKWDRGEYKSIRAGSVMAITDSSSLPDNVKEHGEYGCGVLRGVLCHVKRVTERGVQTTAPEAYVLKCKHCGVISKVDKFKDLESFDCLACKSLRDKKARSIERNKCVARKRELDKLQKNVDKPFLKAGYMLTDVKAGSTLDKRIKTFSDKNKGYQVLSVRAGSGEGSVLTACCNECGTVYPYAINRCDSNIGECEFCKTRKPWELGLMRQSHVGEVHNMLVITEHDTSKCTVKCRMCQKERTGLDLYGVLKNDYICDCKYAESALEDDYILCDYCHEPLRGIKSSDVIMGRESKCVCASCGKKVDINTLSAVLSGNDYKSTLVEKVKVAGGLFKGRFSFDNATVNGLLHEKDPLYIGNTDSLPCYRCYCTIHNKPMILSEKEIASYNHQSCFDERQRVIADINPDELEI